ncbi:MAG: hypothetical protein SFV24_21480 [Gemmatimonadales bacterium]|nr:hypothetical protein [Gemmatimonadota bacterium]MDX2060396.1 hypothetical protein [Gemmatimonadales bacterium]
MKKLAMAVAGAVLLVGLASKPAEAQVQFGANVVWGDDADFGVGARLGFPLGQALKDKGITALATFDYFFPDYGTLWELTGNGVYNIKSSGSVSPYVGAGVSFASASVDNCPATIDCSSSDFGLNVLGGIKFKAMGNVVPFVEARFGIRDGSQLAIAGGVYFGKP